MAFNSSEIQYFMDLFGFDTDLNVLPYDGDVRYFGSIMESMQSEKWFAKLLETIAWRNDELLIYGKQITTKRKTAWYGDEPYCYTYSCHTKTAMPWTPELLSLKKIIEEKAGSQFNSCLLNLYHAGDEGMSWHSDDEKELGDTPTIASFSLGASRKFSFKHKHTKENVSLMLESGSLLMMQGSTQQHWMHSLPKTTKVSEPRINLTFRTIYSR